MNVKEYYCLIFIFSCTVNSAVSEAQICPSLEDLGLDFDLQSSGLSCRNAYDIFGQYGSLTCSYASLYGDNIPWDKLHEMSFADWFEEHNIAKEANELADDLAEDIKERSRRFSDRDYHKEPLISKPPPNAQNLWTYEILENSMEYLSTSEQIIVFLNGGNITDKGCRKCRKYSVLAEITEDKEDMDEFIYEELPVLMQFAKMQILSNSQMLNCAPKIAGEFYQQFQQSNDTLTKTFMELVNKEKFVNYITELTKAVENLAKSGKTMAMVQKLYENWIKNINKVDWNRVAAADYFTLLSVRSLLLNIDVVTEVEKINDLYYTIDEAMWKTSRGKWPEMAKFIDNLLRLTFGSKPFWEKFDVLYHAAVSQYQAMFLDRQKDLSIQIEMFLLPIFRQLLAAMKDIADGNNKILEDMDKYMELDKVAESIRVQMEWFGKIINDGSMGWTLKRYLDQEWATVRAILSNNQISLFLSDTLLSNWPNGEKYPKSFDLFFEKVYKQLVNLMYGIPFVKM